MFNRNQFLKRYDKEQRQKEWPRDIDNFERYVSLSKHLSKQNNDLLAERYYERAKEVSEKYQIPSLDKSVEELRKFLDKS